MRISFSFSFFPLIYSSSSTECSHTQTQMVEDTLFYLLFSPSILLLLPNVHTRTQMVKDFFFVCLFVPSILLLQLLSELLIHVSGVRIPFSFLPCSIFTHNDGVRILLFIYFHLTNLFYLSNNVL